MTLRGGFGLDPYGRSHYGNRASSIGPRFGGSVPNDGQHNVPVDQALKFVTYCFSSYVDIANTRVHISEDGGVTFVLAFDGSVFQAPYTGRVRRLDGQQLVYYVKRTGDWPEGKRIVVRFTGEDDFGNESNKVTPKRWAT